MCGRFSTSHLPESIIKALNVVPDHFNLREQVYPRNQVDVVFRGEDRNEITQMTWGWERSFSKRPLINTRSAEAWNKRTWSKAMYERRCIMRISRKVNEISIELILWLTMGLPLVVYMK